MLSFHSVGNLSHAIAKFSFDRLNLHFHVLQKFVFKFNNKQIITMFVSVTNLMRKIQLGC